MEHFFKLYPYYPYYMNMFILMFVEYNSWMDYVECTKDLQNKQSLWRNFWNSFGQILLKFIFFNFCEIRIGDLQNFEVLVYYSMKFSWKNSVQDFLISFFFEIMAFYKKYGTISLWYIGNTFHRIDVSLLLVYLFWCFTFLFIIVADLIKFWEGKFLEFHKESMGYFQKFRNLNFILFTLLYKHVYRIFVEHYLQVV